MNKFEYYTLNGLTRRIETERLVEMARNCKLPINDHITYCCVHSRIDQITTIWEDDEE